jgi:CheY-like chemotaxis protein
MRHILVVDDDPAICEVMQMGLEMDGTCRVTQAANAIEAMDAARHDRPDVAIVDAILPRRSGLALALDLVELSIPVLITSGGPEQQYRLDEAGCYFLRKPFSFARLAEEVRVLLADSAQRRAQLATALRALVDARGRLADTIDETARLVADARWRRMGGLFGRPPSAARLAKFNVILTDAIEATAAEMGTLQLAHPDTGILHIVASRGFAEPFLRFFDKVAAGDASTCGAALLRRERIIVPDVERSTIFAGKPSGQVLRAAGVRSVQSTPIVNGGLLGVLSTHRRSVWMPGAAELTRLDVVVARAVIDLQPT